MELTQEQVNNVIEAFNKICEIVKEVFERIKEVFERIKEAFNNFINSFDTKKMIKILKYDRIYRRTHNKRIKKKQLKKIKELLM